MSKSPIGTMCPAITACLSVSRTIVDSHKWGLRNGCEYCQRCAAHVVQYGPERHYSRVPVDDQGDDPIPLTRCWLG